MYVFRVFRVPMRKRALKRENYYENYLFSTFFATFFATFFTGNFEATKYDVPLTEK
jgi:hypothetical protein